MSWDQMRWDQMRWDQMSNPEFESHDRVVHGEYAPVGKYPWAVVLTQPKSDVCTEELCTYCGGTLISNRHILTARHCLDNIHSFESVSIFVGGVCYAARGPNCSVADMQKVEVEFGAYEKREDGDEEPNSPAKTRNMGHDMAILQLKQDLVQLADEGDSPESTRPACMPLVKDKIPPIMHVYGWGSTDAEPSKSLDSKESCYFQKSPSAAPLTQNSDDLWVISQYSSDALQRLSSDTQQGTVIGSAHLMEVDLKVMDLANDPLTQDPDFTAGGYAPLCSSERLYCMHPANLTTKKDAAGGDSGTGIIGRKGPLHSLFGITVAGAGDDTKFPLNIGLRTQALLYDICHYTGVCVEREWIGKTDPAKVSVDLTKAFYDPLKATNIEADD
uniref:Peptidase S1 domain-containing protein n=1 Tax=Ditylenchus dipsaci TaxID=166011 RepID=A0A915CWH2_9BILA